MIRNWLVIAGALVLLGAAACGDDDGGGSGGTGGQNGGGNGNGSGAACDVFSSAELGDVLGTPMGPGASNNDVFCDWSATDEEKGTSVSLQIFRGGASTYDETLAALKANFDSATFTDLTGVGDEAYIMVHELEVLGFNAVTVQAGATTGDDLVVVTTGEVTEVGATSSLEDATRELLERAVDRI